MITVIGPVPSSSKAMLPQASSFLAVGLGARRSATSLFSPCRLCSPALDRVRYASSKRGGSSSRYMQRQKADVYVRQRSRLAGAKKQNAIDNDDLAASSGGYVARSAFKLLQLDDRYKFLRAGRVIVDLGAAPGGWSQAIVERTRGSRGTGKEGQKRTGTPVFALDLLPVADIEGVTSIQGDFLDIATQDKLRQMVADAALGSEGGLAGSTQGEGFVDVVVSDMMANTTGNPIVDTEASLELCRAATIFAIQTLKRDESKTSSEVKERSPKTLASKSSVLVMKYFMSHEADVFRKEVLESNFHFVKAEKMDASRKESREQFWICIGFKGQPHN